jgi:hypothetical protein
MVAFMIDEDLCFILQPPKRLGMDHPVPVPLKGGAVLGLFFRVLTPLVVVTLHGIWGECLFFDVL